MHQGREVEEIINDNDKSIQRRINMMGQHLANVGISDVTVEVTIKIKGSDSGGNFEKVRSGKYGKYTKGKGSGKIGGSDDNVQPITPTTKTVHRPSVFSQVDNSGITDTD